MCTGQPHRPCTLDLPTAPESSLCPCCQLGLPLAAVGPPADGLVAVLVGILGRAAVGAPGRASVPASVSLIQWDACSVGARASQVAACSSLEGWTWPSPSSSPRARAPSDPLQPRQRVRCSHLVEQWALGRGRAGGTRLLPEGCAGGLEPLTCVVYFRCTGSHCGRVRRPSPRDCARCCRSSFSPVGQVRLVGLRLLASAIVCTPCRTQAPACVHSAGPSSLPRPSLGWMGARARSVRRKAKPGLQLACQVRRERDPGIRLSRDQDSSVVKPTN